MSRPPPPGPPPGPPPPLPPSIRSQPLLPPPPPPPSSSIASAVPQGSAVPFPPLDSTHHSTASASASKPQEPSKEEAAEAERLLTRERNSLFQQLEIDRILSAFRLNPYDVLEVPLEADEKEINKIYRKKSLLIHPDKVKDERAVEAFDLLKKASTHLLDEDKRKALDETVMDARLMTLKELDLPFSTPTEDKRLQNLVPSWEERVRKATKELMVDDELRRRKAVRLQHQAEGEAQRKKEEAAGNRKRKVEEEAAWEASRDTRVAGWRTFQKGGKKKKKESNVLG